MDGSLTINFHCNFISKEALGDIVFVELPEEGRTYEKEGEFNCSIMTFRARGPVQIVQLYMHSQFFPSMVCVD